MSFKIRMGDEITRARRNSTQQQKVVAFSTHTLFVRSKKEPKKEWNLLKKKMTDGLLNSRSFPTDSKVNELHDRLGIAYNSLSAKVCNILLSHEKKENFAKAVTDSLNTMTLRIGEMSPRGKHVNYLLCARYVFFFNTLLFYFQANTQQFSKPTNLNENAHINKDMEM